MTPNAIYVTERIVFVQWHERGAFVALHEDGTVTEQFREPEGQRVNLNGKDD